MTGANSRQEGGTHYRSSYQHWDWVVDVGANYFVACATGYVTRWRQKNGVEDLRKAKHYVQKLQEVLASLPGSNLSSDYGYPPLEKQYNATLAFAAANTLTATERMICMLLAVGTNQRYYTEVACPEAVRLIEGLISSAPHGKSVPVPLTEENHHAERVGATDGSE